MELSEERQKETCECEICHYYPLKHFQRCPRCRSESFHLTKHPEIKK